MMAARERTPAAADRHRRAARHRPGCGELEGVTLHDIDDLQAVVARNLDPRASEVPRAEEIVEEEIQRFARWLGQLDVLPTMSALREHGDELVERVLAENAGRWESASPRDLARVEALARAVMSRLLHEPTIRLRSLSRRAATPASSCCASCSRCATTRPPRRPPRSRRIPPAQPPRCASSAPPPGLRSDARQPARSAGRGRCGSAPAGARSRSPGGARRRAAGDEARGRDDHDQRDCGAAATAARAATSALGRHDRGGAARRRDRPRRALGQGRAGRARRRASSCSARRRGAPPRTRSAARAGSTRLPQGARVGTSSLRRAAQLRGAREDLEVVALHGNVDTRLRELATRRLRRDRARAGRAAAAGPRGWTRRGSTSFVPAPGQGTLALEAAPDDARVAAAVRAISDADASRAAAERALVRALGASCDTPLGAHARARGRGCLNCAPSWGCPTARPGSATSCSAARSRGARRGVAERLRAAGAGELLRRAEELAVEHA